MLSCLNMPVLLFVLGRMMKSRGVPRYSAKGWGGGGHMEGSGELASLVLKKVMGRYRLLKQKLTGKKR